MTLIVPFSKEKLDDTQEIIAITSNEFAPYIAFLSPSSIYIRDLEQYSIPVIDSFTRSPESIQNSGRNCWVQWFNKTIIFYGTSAGTIFLSRVGSLDNVKELFIEKVILSSFVCHNNLAVTTATSQIYFINSNCEINFYVTLFDIPKGIRHCTFHSPSTLSCIVDGEPYFISIDKDSFSKKYEPIPKRIPISNANLTALSLKHSLLAVSKDDGEIILINVSPKKSQPIIAYKNELGTEKDFVAHMFWTMNENCLIAIKESGKIIIWCFSTYEVKIENEIQTAYCFCFEQRTHRLYWSNMKEIHFLAFSAILDHYAMSSHQLVDLFKKKSEDEPINTENSCNKNEVVFSDPENVFPLIFLAASDGHFAVASLKKFSIDGKKTIEMETVGLTFFNGLLAVFEIDSNLMKYYLNFFEIQNEPQNQENKDEIKGEIKDEIKGENKGQINGEIKDEQKAESKVDSNDACDDPLEVKLIGKVNFPFFPRQISIFQNEMVVLGNSKYCKVIITDDKFDPSAGSGADENKDDKNDENDDNSGSNILGGIYNKSIYFKDGAMKYVSLYTEGFCCQILSAFVAKKNSLALLLESNDVFLPPGGPYICKSVDCAWSFNEGELPIIFMHSGSSTIISCFLEKVRVESFPVFTDGYRMFNLRAKMAGLGDLEFESRNFGHFFLAHLAGQTSSESENDAFSVLNGYYQKKFPNEYPKILAEAIIKAFPIEKEMELMKRIKKKNVLTVAIVFALSKMPVDMRVAMFKNCDVDWSAVIPLLKGNLQYLAFSSIPFEKFVTFVENDKCIQKVKEPIEILNTAIKENSLLRGFLLASKLNMNFSEKLNEVDRFGEMNLDECIKLVEKEKKNIESFDKNDKILRFFGSSMQAGGFCLLSLATFAILNDQMKIQSIYIIDESIIEKVKEYIENFPDSQYKHIFENALNEVSDAE